MRRGARPNRARTGIARRSFLWIGAAAGTGLVIGYPLRRLFEGETEILTDDRTRWGPPTGEPWMWIAVGSDDLVTIAVPRCEMGQGIATALPMIVAEELEVDWANIRITWASLDPAYGRQLTGASDAVRGLWDPLRNAGAAARELLISAGAQRWGEPRESCRAAAGTVVHDPTGRSVRYGVLAEAASKLPLPAGVRLKSPTTFQLIGKPISRLDIESKVTGRAEYGVDVHVPGMLVATVAQSPVYGGTIRTLDEDRARAVPGVRAVVRLGRSRRSGSPGVAVVADGFWAAQRGIAALDIRWNDGPNAGASTSGVMDTFRSLAEHTGRAIVHRGESRHALAEAARRIDAIYEAPFLAHASMEPMSCMASVTAGACEIWAPTQNPHAAQATAADVAGLPRNAVTVRPTYAGGGFGRRQRTDFVAQAVEISKAVGVPVKVIWSREEDIQQGTYRPATYNQLSAGVGAAGWPTAWLHRLVGFGGTDDLLTQGIDDVPYAIPNKRIELFRRQGGPVRTGPWRALARSQNAFVTECFLDEVAYLGGHDPLEFRLKLLDQAPRFQAVLTLAAERAGWGGRAPSGRTRGVALTENFGGICAQVAEISVQKDSVRVHRVVCALDCGQIINPDTVVAQMQGGIIFGLSAALREEITLERGRVQQSSFDDYAVLRMSEAPSIDVVIVPSVERPGGVGETAVPPIAPAVANALFAATGRRVRKLPIHAADLSGRAS